MCNIALLSKITVDSIHQTLSSLYQQILRAGIGVLALESEIVAAEGVADFLGGDVLQRRLAILALQQIQYLGC